MEKRIHHQHDSSEGALDLHIAEYQALMNRNTYLVTLQFSLWPVLLVFFTLVAQIWNLLPQIAISGQLDGHHRLLMWSALVAIQLIGAAWVQLAWEQLSNILYIERHVRPLISGSLPECRFWRYEAYLAGERGSKFVGDYWLTAGAIVLIPLMIVRALPFSEVDYFGLGINLIFCIFLVKKTLDLTGIRRVLVSTLSGQF